ncbi:MAG: Nif3-like dinuclear metal center hexameric protein [Gammaproteobacteria bacterium]|jgi:dinuclear metal center YbgI/SA1388 family protein|nr:Nif3-like dinuclear metal center hexameric protein [Gammaproteobacteria bacterium]MBQ0775321.1 Nif3-like dinuclear metal center hexameric protein [Gammaproteobacteria bacterium]|tara:strand:- start:110615 stop:111373 length:759 start_codon:yes stop_codon:yes gene_type:complete
MIKRDAMLVALDKLLQPAKYRDYCPNGLQVEGREQVRRVVTGVTASQALLDAAVVEGADAILVHHGYFWKGEDARVRGMKKQRLQTLLAHDISLFAYHLPLDGHPQLGNNVALARVLGLEIDGVMEPGNPLSIGLTGRLPHAMSAEEFADYVESRLGREVLHIGESKDEVETLAWCTGAAQGFIEQAQALGVDAYLSGEISEPTVHIARETGIHYFACGHHATERYGIQAVGEWLAEQFDIEHVFIDIDNPV